MPTHSYFHVHVHSQEAARIKAEEEAKRIEAEKEVKRIAAEKAEAEAKAKVALALALASSILVHTPRTSHSRPILPHRLVGITPLIQSYCPINS